MANELVLVVEDDADLALGVAIRLQSAGYRAITVEDSITALATAKRERPQLIVLDLGLPGGDGLTFLGRLRSLTQIPFMPVIVLTARGPEHEEAALRAGAQAFLQKPVDNEALLSQVKQLLTT